MSRHQRSMIPLFVGVVCLILSGGSATALAPPGTFEHEPSYYEGETVALANMPTQQVHVKSLLDGQDVQGSSATLMRRSDGLAVSVHTRELTPGESVDVFWAIFNRPEACVNPNPLTGALCTPPDLFVPNTLGSLHYVATLTADGHGKLSYRSSLPTDSDIGCVGDPFPCNTLTDPFGAEVHSPMFVPNGGPGRQAAQFLPLQATLPDLHRPGTDIANSTRPDFHADDDPPEPHDRQRVMG